MTHDPLQEIWNNEEEPSTVKIDKEWLLNLVRKKQRDFNHAVLRRDILEIGIHLLCAPIFVYYGITSAKGGGQHVWTWYLVAVACIWNAGFFVANRLWWKKKTNPTAPSTSFLDRSMSEIENQIWLLKNILWWYLLPPGIAFLCVYLQRMMHKSGAVENADQLWETRWDFAVSYLAIVVVFGLLYYINQRYVRTELEPRKRELSELRENLIGEEI